MRIRGGNTSNSLCMNMDWGHLCIMFCTKKSGHGLGQV